MRDTLKAILENGTQANLLNSMQTRSALYQLIGYKDYEGLDASLSAPPASLKLDM